MLHYWRDITGTQSVTDHLLMTWYILPVNSVKTHFQGCRDGDASDATTDKRHYCSLRLEAKGSC